MITASHNRAEYNRLKIFKCGKKLSKLEESILEEKSSYIDDYYNYLLKFNISSNKKIAIDCANGATSNIAKKNIYYQ